MRSYNYYSEIEIPLKNIQNFKREWEEYSRKLEEIKKKYPKVYWLAFEEMDRMGGSALRNPTIIHSRSDEDATIAQIVNTWIEEIQKK